MTIDYAISMCDSNSAKTRISHSYRLSYGQVLGECGGLYKVGFLLFKIQQIHHHIFHFGNFIYHRHNHKCTSGHFKYIYNLHLFQCQVCCDKRQGRALGNVMQALTETKVIYSLLFQFDSTEPKRVPF